ncbi:MAG: hypothetical protein LBI42_07825 [Chitinispirillales bacterium]|jgi:hypothetical protein|nr:hypothetical protein [Chitinispirillales bacterium]
MHIYKDGEKSKGPCETCRKLVSTTFRYAPLNYGGRVIPDVLQDFCDACGSSVSIPQQSSFVVREYRRAQYNHSLEFRIPPHHRDILIAIGMTHNISHKPNTLFRIISELYLSKISLPQGQKVKKKILSAMGDDLAKGASKSRLSCLFPDTAYSALRDISEEANVKTSSIAKGIIVTAKYDILDNLDKELAKEFEELAAERL